MIFPVDLLYRYSNWAMLARKIHLGCNPNRISFINSKVMWKMNSCRICLEGKICDENKFLEDTKYIDSSRYCHNELSLD